MKLENEKMKEKLEQMYIQAIIDDVAPNVFTNQVLRLLDVVIKSAFIELFDKAACIQHWHNRGKNDEGMVVSSEAVYELWEALKKYRDLRNSL